LKGVVDQEKGGKFGGGWGKRGNLFKAGREASHRMVIYIRLLRYVQAGKIGGD